MKLFTQIIYKLQ